ncbi:MAG: prephenate dehydrogenase/arogenate dehydrogenase family protein [Candidatus Baltobacteraceae bacterium]
MPSADLGLLGTGLIGASIGLRARAAGMRVTGYDARPEHAARALAGGALDAVAAAASELGKADVLVLATPLEVTLATLATLVDEPPAAGLILDVASLKAPVARAGAGLQGFVPTHPIAGSERSGPQAARADLFAGKVWTYEPGAAPQAVERARAFIEALGARPVPLDSVEHDRIVALTSDLPQLAAVALGALLGSRLGEPAVAELCGTGMRGAIRLSASPWSMWRSILEANGASVAQEVRALSAILSEFAVALEAGKPDRLAPRFAAAAAAVALLLGNDEGLHHVHICEYDLPDAR